MCGLTQKGDYLKVFLRFYDGVANCYDSKANCYDEVNKENISVDCDWVSIAPDYLSPHACPDDNTYPFTVRCYWHNDKDYLRIYPEVLDVEVI